MSMHAFPSLLIPKRQPIHQTVFYYSPKGISLEEALFKEYYSNYKTLQLGLAIPHQIFLLCFCGYVQEILASIHIYTNILDKKKRTASLHSHFQVDRMLKLVRKTSEEG